MSQDSERPVGHTYPSLDEAVGFPAHDTLGVWGESLLANHAPKEALRLFLNAVLAPLTNHVGGESSLRRLVEDKVDQIEDDSDGSIGVDEAGGFIAGFLVGNRVAQVQAGLTLLYGVGPGIDSDAIYESGIDYSRTPDAGYRWVGKVEGNQRIPPSNDSPPSTGIPALDSLLHAVRHHSAHKV